MPLKPAGCQVTKKAQSSRFTGRNRVSNCERQRNGRNAGGRGKEKEREESPFKGERERERLREPGGCGPLTVAVGGYLCGSTLLA